MIRDKIKLFLAEILFFLLLTNKTYSFNSFEECKQHVVENKIIRTEFINFIEKIKNDFKPKGKNWYKIDKVGWKNDINYNVTGYIQGYYLDVWCISFKENEYLEKNLTPFLEKKFGVIAKKKWLEDHKNAENELLNN